MSSPPQATDIGIWSPEKPATEHVQKLCDEIRNDLEKKVGRKLLVFKAISYIEMVLPGGNRYVVKIQDKGEVYVHALISTMVVDIESNPSLRGFQDNKKKDDPIVPIVKD